MPQFKLSTLFVALLSGVLAGTVISATLNVGDSFKGEIFVHGTDVVEFEGLAGELISVSVKPMKKQSLVPIVSIKDPEGATIATATATKKKVSLKKVELPVPGMYQIHVTGDSSTHGTYTLTTKGKLSKTITKVKNDSFVDVEDEPFQETPFQAKSSVPDRKDPEVEKFYELSGTISTPKKSDAIAFNPVIYDPKLEPLGLTGFIEKTKKGEFKIKKMPLPDLGDYILSIENSGLSGVINTNLRIKKPKLKKQVFEKDL